MNDKWQTVSRENIRVGHWYSLCCAFDLDVIGDENELDEILEMIDEGNCPQPSVWPSRVAALEDMVKGYAGARLSYIADVEDMLAIARQAYG